MPLGTAPGGPGQTIETNTLMAEAYLTGIGGATCRRYGIVPDEPGLIREAVETAVAENDLVILSAGSSAGTRDFSRDVVEELGRSSSTGSRSGRENRCCSRTSAASRFSGCRGYPVAAQTVLREVAGEPSRVVGA
ncbi:molybdopterin-binding protein [Methanoculleus chikugoensis]|uniref:molybdopterin-binding protein n=1 Tax=Methanoculleus chikugoensis TaxID=118126 RepID=UPI0006D13191|nr:molybdopterin-binding protein [Methanoculleus chikugoensis]